jgi:hypothetical protein
MDLLEKSSILLTPTAYNNGEALCVKPSDGSGDFQFSRNSAATRVNAQGLVENVQILSSNLVQNGDFSEEGVQEVSNGSFSQEGVQLLSQPVNLVTDCLPNGGGVIVDADTFETFGDTFGGIRKNSFLTIGKTYRLTIEGNTTSSGFNIGDTAASGNEYGSGFGTFYFTAVGNGSLWIRQNTSGITNITTFSIREVGQDWTLGTGWSIGEDKAVFDGVSNANLTQSNILTNGKQYKLTYEILENTTTSGYIRLGAETATAISQLNTSIGTHTMYFTNDGYTASLVIRTNSLTGGVLSITNISVKEVGMDWDLGNWSVGDSLASSGATSFLQQPNIYTSTTSIYKSTFKARSVSGASVPLRLYDGSGNYQLFTITSSDFQDFELTRQRDGSNATLYIYNNSGAEIEVTNISVIEITSDTNLPRISYENFSYQDALGSELVTNGDFATDSDWVKQNGATISNGMANFITNLSKISQSISAPTINKVYRVEFDSNQINLSTTAVIIYGNGFYGLSNIPSVGKNILYITTNLSGGSQINTFQLSAGANGTIDNVSVKEYLGQIPIPNSGCGSWLWEPQSTNLLPYSEDFSNSAWSKTRCTIDSGGHISPSGESNAFKMTATDNDARLQDGNSPTGVIYTQSIYVKSATGSDVSGQIDFTGTQIVTFTATEQWQRVTTTSDNTRTGSVRVRITNSGDELLIWGAQLETSNGLGTFDGSYATSYIPTSGQANGVTRNQDVCNNGGSLATINSTEGVLYAEIAALSDDLTFRSISLNDGTNSNSVGIRYRTSSNKINAIIKDNNGVNLQMQVDVSDITQFNKIALKYKSGDVSMYINGTEVATNSTNFSFTSALNNLSFDRGDNNDEFFGKTKALAVWKEALTDQELTELTTI